MSKIRLINGDSLIELDKLEPNLVDSITTDPPYHLTSIVKRFGKKGSAPAKEGKDGSFQRLSKGFMGKEWDGGDIAFTPEIWEKCLRVLKPGGYMLCFGSPRSYHRMAIAIEDAGFEIRDCMMYMYGSGFPKSHSIKGVEGYDGWGTGLLKPAYEPIVMARKPLDKGLSIAKNIKKWGVGGHNVDACRITANDVPSAGKRTKNCHSDEEVVSGGNGSPNYVPNANGRFPANVIFDEEASEKLGDKTRYFYTSKPSKFEKNAGLNEARNTNPCVKPVDLLEYLMKLVTPVGGTILDPFCGSGSGGIASQNLDFNYIGIEREEEYFTIAEKRIAYWKEQLDNRPIDIFKNK